MNHQNKTINISIVATPDTQVSPLSGLYETFNSFDLLSNFEKSIPVKPFSVNLITPGGEFGKNMMGYYANHCHTVDEINHTDIAIVPLMMVKKPGWIK
ncbi:MAG: hypothetical protein P8X42_15875, partial [Calditrichaceae bacterium]